MLELTDGMALKMGYEPSHGCYTLMEGILQIATDLVWKTMMKKRYMLSLIPIL